MQANQATPKVALITGAARRIGAEIARTLHAAGMNIIIHYNASEEEAVECCNQLNKQREKSAVSLRGDLLLPESEISLMQQAVAVWQRLDVLVNNASRYYRTKFGRVTEYSWDDLMNCNLKAPFFYTQEAAPHLAATSGSIINITDIRAERPFHDYSVYSISKSGLSMMTKVLAKELAPLVRVNAIAPGPILWPEGENALSDQEKEKIIESTLLLRPGEPRDIAKAALFLASDANYTTGQTLYVDGGRMLSGIGG
jgi:pteridine reductase